MASTAEKIRERRLDRMRLGQAVCDYVDLPSDPEIKLCIVPLTEAEYKRVLEKIAGSKFQDDLAGAAIKDRMVSQEILVHAIREPDDLTKTVYGDVDEMLEDLEVGDVDFVYDAYNEMTAKSSPALDGLTREEFDHLKEIWLRVDWNVLSGPAWYAAKRFLTRIGRVPLLDSSPGSTSTSSSTTTND